MAKADYLPTVSEMCLADNQFNSHEVKKSRSGLCHRHFINNSNCNAL